MHLLLVVYAIGLLGYLVASGVAMGLTTGRGEVAWSRVGMSTLLWPAVVLIGLGYIVAGIAKKA